MAEPHLELKFLDWFNSVLFLQTILSPKLKTRIDYTFRGEINIGYKIIDRYKDYQLLNHALYYILSK